MKNLFELMGDQMKKSVETEIMRQETREGTSHASGNVKVKVWDQLSGDIWIRTRDKMMSQVLINVWERTIT